MTKSFKQLIEKINPDKFRKIMSEEDILIAEDVHYKIQDKIELSVQESYKLRKDNQYLYETYGPEWRKKAGILTEKCWKGYKQLGVKKKDGKTVPNCVPITEETVTPATISIAKKSLGTLFLFYFKAHTYHWNVVGENFVQLHDLFGSIYEEVFESIDTVAEQIRALDSEAPRSIGELSQLSAISPNNKAVSDIDMVKDLLNSNSIVIKTLEDLFDDLNKNNIQGFANLIAELLDNHKKYSWKLRSITK